jgi:hypothetical protein
LDRPIRHARRVLACVAAALGIAALPAPAVAASSTTTLGPGDEADVLIDRDGVTHVVFSSLSAGVDRLHYSRLAPGRSTATLLPVAGGAGGSNARVFQDPPPSRRLVITAMQGGRVYALTSADGGRTWSTGTHIFDAPSFSAPEQVLTRAGLLLFYASGNQGVTLTLPPALDRLFPRAGERVIADASRRASFFDAAADPAGGLSFAWASGNAAWARVGPTGAIRDLDSANIALAGGSNGFLLMQSGMPVSVRRLTALGVGRPLSLDAENGADVRLAGDESGGFHAAWQAGGSIRYRSTIDGETWGPAVRLDLRTAGNIFTGVRVAGGADGSGAAVWIDAAPARPSRVRFARVGRALPAPQVGRTGNAQVVDGRPRTRLPGSGRFVPIAGGRQIPLGAELDVSGPRDRLRVTTARPGGGVQSGVFYGGRFVLTQARSGLTTQTLSQPLACPASSDAASASRRRVRRLWGNARGRFRTRGRYGTSTVRGTVWLTEDRCDATLVRVTRGSVAVRDLARRRTVIVRAGTSYLARRAP